MDDSAPWRTEETIVGWPRLLVAVSFSFCLECMNAAIPVIADIHSASTHRTVAINDVEFPVRKIRISGPLVRHRADLHALARSSSRKASARAYAKMAAISSHLSNR